MAALDELRFPGLLLVLILGLVVTATAGAETLKYPVPQDACGTLGNVVAIAQKARNMDMPLSNVLADFWKAEQACTDEKGPGGCILQDQEGTEWVGARLNKMWVDPPKDPQESGFEDYTDCLTHSRGKPM